MTELVRPSYQVISIGDLVADIVLTIPRLPVEASQHQPAKQVRMEPGGAGNFLIAGARLGMQMVALGTAGEDPFGDAILSILAQEGIYIHEVVQSKDSTSTTVIVLVDDAGQNVFLGGYGVGPEIELPPSWVESLNTAQAVFASGYTLREQRDAQAALKLMAMAHDRHIPVYFDPGPEMVYASTEQIQSVLRNSDTLLLTEDEIPFLTSGAQGLEAAHDLLRYGPKRICVKRAAKGCILFTDQQRFEHPGFSVIARDPTGAGDSFAAAFIFASLAGWNPSSIIAFANAMGAAKVQKVGSGTQVPTADEIRNILHSNHVSLEF